MRAEYDFSGGIRGKHVKKMIDVKKLCEDSHRISKDKGWLEHKRTFAAVTALIHSELSEAIEDYRSNKPVNEYFYEVSWFRHANDPVSGVGAAEGSTKAPMSAKELDNLRDRGAEIISAKPCGVPSELADVIIRIAQHCGTEGQAVELASHISFHRENLAADPQTTFEEFIAYAHCNVADSFRSFVRGESSLEVIDHLALLWVYTESYCKNNDINLEAAVLEKQAFNETRPHRHGNKKI